MKGFGLFGLLLGVALFLGCGGGPKVDDVADEVEGVVIEGTEDAGDAVKDAGDAVKDAADDTLDAAGDVISDTGSAIEDAGDDLKDAAGGND